VWLEKLLGRYGKCSSAFRTGTRQIVLKRERIPSPRDRALTHRADSHIT
jgi:hypothetical protein